MSHCISTNTILTALKLNGPASLFPRNRSFPINQATRINQDNVSVSSDHQRARTLEPCTHNDPGDPQPGSTLGAHLARRLVQIGVTDVFAVPGDSNVVLLDHLIAEPGLRLIGCCNELNAGYAADGYARARGVGVVAVTFTVGGLSVVNAVAGAYSESLPLICIVGGPSSNYYGKDLTLHHTVGLPDFSQELRCYESVTCHQAVVKELGNAREQIDRAIRAALEESKPVYISICCNLAGIPHPSFHRKPFPIFPLPRKTNPVALQAAVDAATKLLTAAKSPILLGGAKLRAGKSLEAFTQLAKATGYTTAVMPAAKGMISEDHPQFIGTFWDGVTMSLCADIVNAADACLYAGPIFYDFYSSKKKNSIIVHPDHVEVGESLVLSGILMEDFLRALSLRFQGNTRASENRLSRCPPVGFSPPARPREPLKVEVLFREIQRTISSDSVVVSDVGDSWLNTQNLRLPPGCGYEVQLHYASMGWSVGATLGYAQAAPEKRVIACMGDGSFQMAAQEVSTMLRCGQKSIIFVINNGGYTTEALLHDGPYNVIKNWDYTGLVGAIQNEEGKLWTAKVRYEDELVAAIDVATGDKKDCLCFIEAIVDKTDTSKELVQMTSRLATANGAPPVAR